MPSPTLTNEQRENLIATAIEARGNAYAPFSGFLVGSAVLDDRGAVTPGVNVENSSYGLTICAERVAVGAAVASGAKSIVACAVVAEGAAAPCGACRQFLFELGAECVVLLVDSTDTTQVRETTIAGLLPAGFRLGR